MRARKGIPTFAAAAACGLFGIVAIGSGPAFAGSPADSASPAGTAIAEPLSSQALRPPRIPRDFRGRGRYIVRDLGITVPFTWRGADGNSKMVAGGRNHPIRFVNLIYGNRLYTVTYKWPGLESPTTCAPIPGLFFNRHVLNTKPRS